MEPDGRPDPSEKEVLAPGRAPQPLGDAGALEPVIRAQKGRWCRLCLSAESKMYVVHGETQGQGVGSFKGGTQPAWGQNSWRTWPMALQVGSVGSELVLKGSNSF